MQNPILIGLGAGLASAMLYASAWTGTVLGLFVLFFLSPMPVAIAGLGWGWGAGIVSAAVGATAVMLAGGFRSAVVYVIAIGTPAAVFSYFAMLNRATDSSGAVEWYPVGRIVAWATLWSALAAVAAVLSIGTDVETIRASLLDLLNKTFFAEGNSPGNAKLTPQQKSSFAALMASFLPWAFATTWFTVAMLNMWAAGHVTARSGRLARPWPDFTDIALPPWMPLAFGASVLGMLASDMLGLIAACFASALLFAFMLVGLGVLHRVTRGYAVRPAVLTMAYASLMLLPPFSNLLIALIGLAEPFLRGRAPPPRAPPPANGMS